MLAGQFGGLKVLRGIDLHAVSSFPESETDSCDGHHIFTFSTAYIAPSRSEAIRQAFAAGAEAEIKGAASRNAAPIATIDYPRPRGCGAIGPTDSLNTVRRPSSQFKALMATMPLQPLSDQPSLKSRHQLAALRKMKFAASVVTTNAKTTDPSTALRR